MTVTHPTQGELFASEYVLAAFTADDPEYDIWQIRVVWSGKDLWAVQQGGFRRFLNRDGEWESAIYVADGRVEWDAFLLRTRYGFDEACTRAKQALPLLKINGLTAGDVLRQRNEKRPTT